MGRFGRARGYTTTEAAVALGIVGLLSAVGLSTLDLGGQELTAVQIEFHGSLHEAFHLAWAQGRNVTVALGDPGAPGILPVRLPPRIRWGLPSSIPPPPGMARPVVALDTGMAHARITVTPRHTATASVWFVNDGREALCMRVSGRGHIQILRWSGRTGQWRLG